jgi:hypothetical protein
MDIGKDTLVYIILGVVFVLAQFLRKRKIAQGKVLVAAPEVQEEKEVDEAAFWKTFLGVPPEPDLRTVAEETVPPVSIEPASFQRIDPGNYKPVHPEGSLTDKHDLAETDPNGLAKPPDDEQEESRFDLRYAVIQSVILDRKYV